VSKRQVWANVLLLLLLLLLQAKCHHAHFSIVHRMLA
jgi:hypothetical protein